MIVASPRPHRGLSYSSASLFQRCPRKYYLKKIKKVAIDADASEDTEAFSIGKAFHKVLEDCKHYLNGITYDVVLVAAESFGLGEGFVPMIFAMLQSYKKVHEKAGLKALACEVVIDTETFFGIVDVVLEDEKGFWLGDMKTSASFYSSIIPSLPNNMQLNLYAYHYREVAEILGLEPDRFLGCRYRVTTKSKLVRKKNEALRDYIQRLSGSVATRDIVIPKSLMNPEKMWAVHEASAGFINTRENEESYQPNYNECNSFFRPCEVWSHCHGKLCSEMKSLEVVEA